MFSTQIPRGLEMFVIYHNPRDYPGKFVTRRWLVHNTMNPDLRPMAVEATIEDARRALPSGLVKMHRIPGDDRVIVESWV